MQYGIVTSFLCMAGGLLGLPKVDVSIGHVGVNLIRSAGVRGVNLFRSKEIGKTRLEISLFVFLISNFVCARSATPTVCARGHEKRSPCADDETDSYLRVKPWCHWRRATTDSHVRAGRLQGQVSTSRPKQSYMISTANITTILPHCNQVRRRREEKRESASPPDLARTA